MPQNAASHQGLQGLPLIQQFLDTTSVRKLLYNIAPLKAPQAHTYTFGIKTFYNFCDAWDPIYTGLVTTVPVLYLLGICCRGWVFIILYDEV